MSGPRELVGGPHDGLIVVFRDKLPLRLAVAPSMIGMWGKIEAELEMPIPIQYDEYQPIDKHDPGDAEEGRPPATIHLALYRGRS